MKLGSKLLVQTVVPAVIAIVVLLGIVTQVASTALQEAAQRALSGVAEARSEALRDYLDRMQSDMVTMASAPAVVRALEEFSSAYSVCGSNSATQLQQLYDATAVANRTAAAAPRPASAGKTCRSGYEHAHELHDAFFRKRHLSYGWHDMLLVDQQGNLVYSLRKANDFATNLLTGPWKDSGLARVVTIALNKGISDMPAFADAARYPPAGNRPGMFLAIPVLDPHSGLRLGVLAVQLDLEPLDQHLHFKGGLGETGESFLVGTDGWLLTNTFFLKEFSVFNKQLKTEAVRRALAGNEGNEQLIDYRGIDSFIAYRPYKPFPGALGDQPTWAVIAKINRDEALASLYSLQWLMLGCGLLIALLAVGWGVFAGRRLFLPVRAMRDALTRLAGGEPTPIPGLERSDEIGEMAQAADKFREMSAAVARDRWVREHVAALTTEVSQETTLARVPDIILKSLRQQLDVPVASLFLRETDGNYRRVGAQGLARRSQSQDSFAPGESLVGQCARDRQPVILSPVPAGLVLIATGLAEFPPEELVLYPVAHQDETLAVVELALTRKLLPKDHAFLAALIEPLGLHLANIRIAERNLALLEEGRAQTEVLGRQKTELDQKNSEMLALADEMRGQAEELKSQNEEFRANQEELRAQQEELAHKNLALEAQGRQLEFSRQDAEGRARELAQSNQYKSQFLANMSHELRTPLNSILILAKHLASNTEGHLDKEEIESASVIHESGEQLLSLINDILDLSKIEAGKLEMQAEDFAVADMQSYLRRLFEPLAAKKSIGFVIDDGNIDAGTLRSDRRHLTQVLTNLLSNAIKFTEHGTVRLAVRAEGDWLRFDIIDSGIGIASDKLEHIFGAFQQLDGGTARKYGGSGLGLAISRQLVNLLGGRLEVESTPGSGSRFSVLVPRVATFGAAAAPVLAATVAAAASVVVPAVSTLAGSRATLILVVEDDGRLLPIVTRLIETLGYAVRAVDSGEKALALITRERPAGVLLDLGLPGLSGMEVLRRLKSDPSTAGIPVYIMSGAPDNGEARTLGAAGYIRKPITRDAVLAAIRAMVDSAAPVAAPAAALASNPAPVASGPALARPRVLLVEDDEASALAVRVVFKDTPVEFSVVRLGGEALTALEGGGFNAVILDLTLPDMSGFEWLEQATARCPQHPPVVVYSARDLADAEIMQLRTHADAVVSKGRLNGQTSVRLREEVLHALAVAAPVTAQAMSTPSLAAAAARRGSLLIVDDDVRNLSALSKVLRSRGFAVSVAGSGLQALEMVAGGRFDVILSDIMMPEMDGYEFMRRLRAGVAPSTPIIAVTAKAMSGDIELCLAAGASDYLAKPVDIDRLLVMLAKWL